MIFFDLHLQLKKCHFFVSFHINEVPNNIVPISIWIKKRTVSCILIHRQYVHLKGSNNSKNIVCLLLPPLWIFIFNCEQKLKCTQCNNYITYWYIYSNKAGVVAGYKCETECLNSKTIREEKGNSSPQSDAFLTLRELPDNNKIIQLRPCSKHK